MEWGEGPLWAARQENLNIVFLFNNYTDREDYAA
jgi:hypothetical protein